MHNEIILIGGAPTAGKSFLAKKLSEDLKIPWISTDTIRGFMREMVGEVDYPDLFYFTKQDPSEYLSNKTAQQVVDDENKESLDVWRGVEAFIKTDHNWDSFIIEGIAVLPALVKKGVFNKKIKPVFILNDNEERIGKIIYERGLWADAKKYPDYLKEKEIKWVVAFNGWLENQLKKYNYPSIKYSDKEFDISQIKKFL